MKIAKMIEAVLSFFALIVVLGCTQNQGTDTSNQIALLQSADGKSYSVSCLKQTGPSRMGECEVAVETPEDSESRAFYGNTSSSSNSDYYYYNLFGFNQNDICQYLWGISSCYNYFGYNNYTPSYNYGSCSGSYLGGYGYGRLPYYCYWNYNKATTRLKMKIKPFENTANTYDTFVSLDSYGRVIKKKCYRLYSNYCSSEIVAYVSSADLALINNEINIARSGVIYKADTSGEIQCFAAATEQRIYTADANQVFIKSQNYPCSSGIVYYNGSTTTESIVTRLNQWGALGN